MNPKLGEAHNNLAVVLMMNGRLIEAEEEVRLAERAGLRLNQRFKDDLQERKTAAGVR